MTQEQKDLLLKDLCARLPYGVKVNVKGAVYDNRSCRLTDIHHGLDTYIGVPDGMQYHIETIKPYLFPLSSMTEEQIKEWNILAPHFAFTLESIKIFAFYHQNHIDYNGLIEKGLAIDATGLNIY